MKEVIRRYPPRIKDMRYCISTIMARLKVQGHVGLVRDSISNASHKY